MPADDYTPTTEQVCRAYTTGMRQTFIASAGEHAAEFDRFLEARDAQVRADAGAQALRDAADDLAVQANEPGLIERADRYQGYYAGVRSAMQDAETKLRARADTITQEDTP